MIEEQGIRPAVRVYRGGWVKRGVAEHAARLGSVPCSAGACSVNAPVRAGNVQQGSPRECERPRGLRDRAWRRGRDIADARVKNAARMSEIERRTGAGCFVIGLPPTPRPSDSRRPRVYSLAFAALLPLTAFCSEDEPCLYATK